MKNLNITHRNKMTPRNQDAKTIERLTAQIAHAESVLAWQIAEGYEPQAENSRREIAKLQAKLNKLV